ncbi:hypothetical protein F511_32189 [Dorcoceras hygrometricum]|uniref:Uncharacterized protein n=1 Tax=Dorcoceras hygrometricum TaxID=472368 RepID=A0A2Z7D7K6_9LAMI|nr:hypothetical protein F511_32189 [Dorcoceras hygrometricum]
MRSVVANHGPGSSPSTRVTLNGSGIQLAVGPQPLWLRNHNFGLAQRILVKRLATSCHDPLGITDSACKNQLVVVSVQYGPFNTYIPIRSMTIDSIGYPRMRASGESSTTKHRLLHASGPHPIPPPNDPNIQYGPFYTYIPIRSTTIGKSRVAIDPIAMHTSWRSNSDIASVTSYTRDVTIRYPRISGQSTGCVLGKWVYLVTLAMSLFDIQDVCIAIGSLATLDLPMVVDLIGIYVLKGPYCTLTMTNWFLQALSVIPRGSWGDFARRFTMIRWASPKL